MHVHADFVSITIARHACQLSGRYQGGGDPLTEEQSTPPSRIRWGWITSCFVSGGLLTGAALLVEDRWGWQGVMPSILVNVGTALGLAGVLFILERRFTGTVVRASERVAAQVAQQVGHGLEQRTTELAARLDSLQEQLDQRLRRRAAEQDAAISTFADDVSFDTLTTMFTEANRSGAVRGVLTVQAARNPDGLCLTFRWGFLPQRNQEPRPQLTIEARIESDLASPTRPQIAVEWMPTDSAVDVGHRLIERLRRANRWDGEETLDWALALANLQRAIQTAVLSRRRDDDAWHLRGDLMEAVDDIWFITSAGIECPAHSYFLAQEDFPEREQPFFARLRETDEEAPKWEPERPNWADPDDWARLIRRGRRYFPRASNVRAVIAAGMFAPWEGSPDTSQAKFAVE